MPPILSLLSLSLEVELRGVRREVFVPLLAGLHGPPVRVVRRVVPVPHDVDDTVRTERQLHLVTLRGEAGDLRRDVRGRAGEVLGNADYHGAVPRDEVADLELATCHLGERS